MTKQEYTLLLSYLNKAVNYLEWGAGDSTLYASELKNIKRIYSVESSQEYIDQFLLIEPKIQSALKSQKLTFIVTDIGKTKRWGYPRTKEKKHLWPNYSLCPFIQDKNLDLILIDGRFRVACALSSLLNIKESCTVLIHDFWNRKELYLLLKYYNVIEKADNLVVLRRKRIKNPKKIQKLIKRYQYNPGDKKLFGRIKLEIDKNIRRIKRRLKKK